MYIERSEQHEYGWQKMRSKQEEKQKDRERERGGEKRENWKKCVSNKHTCQTIMCYHIGTAKNLI